MEIVFLLLKWIGGALVSMIITLVASEPLKNWLSPLLSKLGSTKSEGVKGRWLTTFEMNGKLYTEAIEVSNFLGITVGRVFPHPKNHSEVAKVASKRPIRIRGSVKDNHYFTGIWFHPNRRSHRHGAFELLISRDNEKMIGMWLGYSQSRNVIQGSSWEWYRLD